MNNSGKNVKSCSAALLIVLALILPLQSAQAAIPPFAEHAIWVFADRASPSNPISNPESRDDLIAYAAASRVKFVYLSVYRSSDAQLTNTTGRRMYEDSDIADLITKAHANGIQVYAAYGEPDWPSFGCNPDGFPLQRLAEVISYNEAGYSATIIGFPYSGNFDGVMLDIEPPASPGVALLTQYQCFQQQAQANSLKLSVAIRFGWKDMATYNAVTKEFYKHVVDMNADRVVVMGYRDFAGTTDPASDGVIASDQDQIAYARSVNKFQLILAGLETLSTGTLNKETFFEEGQSVLNSVAQVVWNHFGFSSGLGGFAVHNYGNSYLSGISAKWPVINPDFPELANGVEELATPVGSTVTVTPALAINSASVSVTFPSVSAAGYTYVSPINDASAGTLPSNYQLSAGLAFDIATTATFTGPATVCFRNLDVDPAVFPTLRILHNSGPGFVDETILSGPNAPNAATKSICALVNSFSPFVIASLLVDASPPVISNVLATPAVLWPPNGRMVDVKIDYSVSDDSPLPLNPSRIVGISSNEPVRGADAVIVDAHHVRLRAERSGHGTGRTYTITIKATDGAGNSSTRNVTVTVPHDRGGERDNDRGGEKDNDRGGERDNDRENERINEQNRGRSGAR